MRSGVGAQELNIHISVYYRFPQIPALDLGAVAPHHRPQKPAFFFNFFYYFWFFYFLFLFLNFTDLFLRFCKYAAFCKKHPPPASIFHPKRRKPRSRVALADRGGCLFILVGKYDTSVILITATEYIICGGARLRGQLFGERAGQNRAVYYRKLKRRLLRHHSASS